MSSATTPTRSTERRRVLVTGGTRGIGRAIAWEFARRGAEVLLNYRRDEDRAGEAADAFAAAGYRVSTLRADVTNEDDVSRLVEEAEREGPVETWVNNVGSFHFKPLDETSPQEWDATVRSNLTSAFLCSRAILPHMRARRSGQIVNVASLNAEVLRAKPKTLPYAIAKAGIVLLTKTLASTEAKHGIRVNAVSPGFVETGEFPPDDVQRTVPLGRLAEAEEIAKAVAFLTSEDASYITGAILNVHGGALL